MTDDQKIASVNARIAILNADVAGMTALNLHRAYRGETLAYTDEAFEKAIEDSGLRDVAKFFSE